MHTRYTVGITLIFFQKEFCPPLDSALVAALLMETQDPSEHAILKLKSTLKQLATIPDDNVTNSPSFASPERPDRGEQDDSASLSKSHSRSSSSQGFSLSGPNSFSSPIGFLRAAFPNLATHVLEKTLRSYGWSSEAFYTEDDGPGLDMDAIINDLLSEEWYAENEDGNPAALENDRDPPWETTRRSRRIQSGNVDTNVIRPRRGKRHKPEPIPLFDTLQRQRLPIPRSAVVPDTEALDPWSFVDSLAMYLSTLLPQATHSQLLSLFHNPSHATPNEALRAYLDAPLLASTERSRTGIIDMDLQALSELMSVRPDDENVRGNLDCDAKACLKAVDDDVNKAYDLLVLLRDLDVNAAAIHRSFRPTKPSLLELSPGAVQPKSAAATTSSFVAPSMGPRLSHSVPASPLPVKPAPPSSDTWTVVDKKRPKNTISEPPAVLVPSRQTSSRPNGRDSSERNTGTPEECRRKADALQLRRKEVGDLATCNKHAILDQMRLGIKPGINSLEEKESFGR